MSSSDSESEKMVIEKSKKRRKSSSADDLPQPKTKISKKADSDDEDNDNNNTDIKDEGVGSTTKINTTVGGGSNIAIIAQPLATEKLTKKCLKLVKKAAKTKNLRRGVKEVVKAIRKGEKGIAIIAGNITPIDVVTHIPVLCEDNKIPFVFVPAKEELGAAGATKRPTSVVLVQAKKDAPYQENYDKVKKAIGKLAADDDE